MEEAGDKMKGNIDEIKINYSQAQCKNTIQFDCITTDSIFPRKHVREDFH